MAQLLGTTYDCYITLRYKNIHFRYVVVDKNCMLDLLRKEDVVNDLLILDKALILLHDFSPGSPFFDPSKQEDEAVDRAF